jgi:hypothetical protein
MTNADFLNSQVFKVKDCDTNFINVCMEVYRIEDTGRLTYPIEVQGVSKNFFIIDTPLFEGGISEYYFSDCTVINWPASKLFIAPENEPTIQPE